MRIGNSYEFDLFYIKKNRDFPHLKINKRSLYLLYSQRKPY